LGKGEKRKAAREIPADSLLKRNEAKLAKLGVKLTAPELLMEMRELRWDMKKFLEKVGEFAPTLVLIKLQNGVECGGVAGVPWPKINRGAADPAKGSFIFSLGAKPARFKIVKADDALFCSDIWFAFGAPNGSELCVRGDGRGCGSWGQGVYAGPREVGQLVGGKKDPKEYWQKYERWELWRL
jgi:hypothetical protein